MNCEQKQGLIADYYHSVKELSRSADFLSTALATCTVAEYRQLQTLADQVRKRSERALVAIKEHVVHHGCEASGAAVEVG
jgi:hypothetical protein